MPRTHCLAAHSASHPKPANKCAGSVSVDRVEFKEYGETRTVANKKFMQCGGSV